MLPDWVWSDDDRHWMERALTAARAAAASGEVPVGAVVVHHGQEVGWAHNRRHTQHDPSAHAEIVALRQAGAAVGDWRLESCVLYVTLEPCPMCVAACRQARIGLVVWGAADPVMGGCGTVMDLAEDPRLGPPLAQRGGLLAESCADELRRFFAKTRRSS